MNNKQVSSWPCYSEEEADAVRRVVLSNKVNYWTGDECRQFEGEFARWSGVNYAIALGNGTLALDIAFKALSIGGSDEVIVTSRTFIASVSSIVNAGATPVFVDVDLDTQNITPESIKLSITDKTKAIVCVHLAGWPCEMDEIMEIAKEFNLYVVEDCAQAHGAKYKEKAIGSIGHIGCWSFCQDKIMTTGGEGGMVTTNIESLWRKMWAFKDHGKSYEAVYERTHPDGFRWLHESFGSNFRMTEMQAVIGRIQLNRMHEWQLQRSKNIKKIWNTAKKTKGLRVPVVPKYIVHAAYKCYVFVELGQLKMEWDRDRIIKEINDYGAQCFSGSCSEVYLEKAFDNTGLRPKKRLANAKVLGDCSLMFLVHPSLTKDDVDLTCSAIKTVMERAVDNSELIINKGLEL
jgi:dTDP-4-amino-4,6-dideoxygalactose transaminase